MRNIIKVEWLKLRRCQIFLVGIVALALCPIVQYGSQLVLAEEYREPNYDFAHLFASVIWGNSQIFLPISLVMMGGWFIDRESAGDTLKNIVTVPVSMPKLLGGKLIVTGFLTAFFGCYSVAATLLTGLVGGIPGLTAKLAVSCGMQLVAASLTTYLVCMPLILIFGRMRGAYLGGSILTFFLGYSILFFKGGVLASMYPFSAALILVGFDMKAYNGAASAPSLPLAAAGMGFVILMTAVLLVTSGRYREIGSRKPKKKKKHRRGTRTITNISCPN